MKITTTELETMARKIAAETGASLDEVRTGIRIAMAQVGVALGSITVDQANSYLATAKIPARIAVK